MPGVERFILAVVAYPVFQPAQADNCRVSEGARPLKPQLVHVTEVLEQAGLVLGYLAVIVVPGHDAVVNAGALLRAGHPAEGDGRQVEDTGDLSSGLDDGLVFFVPLVSVIVLLVSRHLGPVLRLSDSGLSAPFQHFVFAVAHIWCVIAPFLGAGRGGRSGIVVPACPLSLAFFDCYGHSVVLQKQKRPEQKEMGESQTIRAVRGNLAGQGLREPLLWYCYLSIGIG